MEKTVKITEEAHQALTAVGNKGETYSEIIIRLCEMADRGPCPDNIGLKK